MRLTGLFCKDTRIYRRGLKVKIPIFKVAKMATADILPGENAHPSLRHKPSAGVHIWVSVQKNLDILRWWRTSFKIKSSHQMLQKSHLYVIGCACRIARIWFVSSNILYRVKEVVIAGKRRLKWIVFIYSFDSYSGNKVNTRPLVRTLRCPEASSSAPTWNGGAAPRSDLW